MGLYHIKDLKSLVGVNGLNVIIDLVIVIKLYLKVLKKLGIQLDLLDYQIEVVHLHILH